MPNHSRSLETRVGTAIRLNPHLAGLSLRVETQAGRVVLHGKVGSYYQKQVAQETVRVIDGVDRIENHLEVTGAAHE